MTSHLASPQPVDSPSVETRSAEATTPSAGDPDGAPAHALGPSALDAFDAARAYRLHPKVALRP
nr:hypothetical protein [Micromonospora sp. DSM 115978]